MRPFYRTENKELMTFARNCLYVKLFRNAAANNDLTVSQLLRKFMNEYVQQNLQQDLFNKKG